MYDRKVVKENKIGMLETLLKTLINKFNYNYHLARN